MGTKSIDWRPGPTVCRCCLAEGCYKDISTEYFWMGKREVYSEMLSETFDISIAYSTSGPNSNSRLICEPCISRLRDAAEFKRQVHECEKTFTQYLDPGASSTMLDTQVSVEALDGEVKLEQVKQEKAHSDDDDDFAGPNFPDDDDDDLDDQPLTKFATRVPKKESVDLLDLLDNAKAAEKRKSTTRAKAPPPKKIKVNLKDIQMKPTASKTKSSQGKVLKITPTKPIQVKAVTKVVKKKKGECQDPARVNAKAIIKYTSAYPFRVNDRCILCVFCHELYDDPDLFRRHVDNEHAIVEVNLVFHGLPKSEFIKVDLTNLHCRICAKTFDGLNESAEHLNTHHDKRMNLEEKLGLMPYFLKKDVYNCAVCEKNFPSLFHLNRHTVTHFLSYVCHVCGSSYVATTGLLRHVRSKHQQYEVSCKKCRKVFPNMEAKEKHRRTEKSCMPYCCPKCMERFLDWRSRTRHMESQHGQTRKSYKCVDCDVTFPNENAYYDHFKLHHSKSTVSCKYCGLKFVSKYKLRRHLTKHSILTSAV